MDTSRTIKAKQYQPIKGIRQGNIWTFKSESRDHVSYTVKREGRNFHCGCHANAWGKTLCEHVTAAVLEDAAARYERVSIWTSLEDAKNQRRRYVTFYANETPFYVTYGTRKLTLDNPDVLAVALVGPWVTPQVELIFNWKTGRVVVPGTDLLNEAGRRGWTGDSRGRIRPGVAV